MTTDQTTPRTSHAPPRQSHFWRDTAIIVVVALALSALVRTFLFQAFYVPSESMLPTLHINDRIVVSKLTGQNVNRGDIIVFRDPGDWLGVTVAPAGIAGGVRQLLTWVGLLPSDSGDDLVKRVIGVGGDHIVCCDAQQRIVVNGVGLDEPYLAPGGTAQVRFDVRVPAGRVFVMGDNRGDSSDSRFHLEVAQGTVPLDNVIGPVVALVWPLSRWEHFSTPSTFDNPAISVQGAAPSAGTPDSGGEARPSPPGAG